MSSPLGDRAEARQMRTPIVATRVAKVERAVREHGDGASTGDPVPAAPTRAGDDSAGGRDAAADDDAVVAAAAVAAAQVALEGGARYAQDAVNVLAQAAGHAAADGGGDEAGVGLTAARIAGDGGGNAINKADAGLCVSRGPGFVVTKALSVHEGPAIFIPNLPVEAASNQADHGRKRKAVGGLPTGENVGGKKVKVEGDAAWNEACRDAGPCVTQGSMADHQPSRPDELEAAAKAVEDIGTSAAAFETQMDNLRALSAPHYTVMRLLATKTAAVDKHLASAGKTYRTAVRWAAACHKAMSALDKEYQKTLVRAAVASTATAMLPSEAGTAATHVTGRDGAASAAGRTELEAAAASDSVDSDVILIGISLARDNLKLGTAASTAEDARDRGQQDASQLRH